MDIGSGIAIAGASFAAFHFLGVFVHTAYRAAEDDDRREFVRDECEKDRGLVREGHGSSN